MFIGEFGGNSSTGSAHYESFLDKERFIDFLKGSLILADGRSNGAGADGTSLESGYDRAEDLMVDGIESEGVYL